MTDPPDDDWDMAEEVERRLAITGEHLIPFPYAPPKFRPKTCIDGAHYMRRDPDGRRCWVCAECGHRQPFNLNGDP